MHQREGCNVPRKRKIEKFERQLSKKEMKYCIAGKFSGGKVWQIDHFQTMGERKFGKLIDQPIGY